MRAKEKRPWMKKVEIDLISDILLRLGPKRCLEWGSGYSTAYFSKLIGKDSTWLSVEHNRKWFEKIKHLEADNTRIVNVAPNNYPWTDRYKDGSYEDLRDYIEYPSLKGPFDFVLVDGRARADCLLRAIGFLSTDGIVILHDANRKYYHPSFESYDIYYYLKDKALINGGLWLGSKSKRLNRLIEIERLRRYYRIHSKSCSRR